ncbi:L-histidine N(alpha)-methyltransferase [Poriferisphaera sp. WC338]|uniref:L-histidine N(alpha)-methyltransferase n=1 Tax=Poriferisphaera sp. WC338 TaxID=3425129 RepID=UPI003D817754
MSQVRGLSIDEQMLREVLAGLAGVPKTLPCKYFYDDHGARLFELICLQPEYYPTRTEKQIMNDYVREMSELIGPECVLIELGSGSGEKTEQLLTALEQPAGYVPIDISQSQLIAFTNRIKERFEEMFVQPICMDFTQDLHLPEIVGDGKKRVVYFPGSTIGNFHHDQSEQLLNEIASLVGPGGGLLIGVDLKKQAKVLTRAYNDKAGVTAAFNLNLLAHLNRRIGSNFELTCFEHRGVWNRELGRIEMYLMSRCSQVVMVGGQVVKLKAGEMIRTECSYKYHVDQFRNIAKGFVNKGVWVDGAGLFSVQYFEVPA